MKPRKQFLPPVSPTFLPIKSIFPAVSVASRSHWTIPIGQASSVGITPDPFFGKSALASPASPGHELAHNASVFFLIVE